MREKNREFYTTNLRSNDQSETTKKNSFDLFLIFVLVQIHNFVEIKNRAQVKTEKKDSVLYLFLWKSPRRKSDELIIAYLVKWEKKSSTKIREKITNLRKIDFDHG